MQCQQTSWKNAFADRRSRLVLAEEALERFASRRGSSDPNALNARRCLYLVRAFRASQAMNSPLPGLRAMVVQCLQSQPMDFSDLIAELMTRRRVREPTCEEDVTACYDDSSNACEDNPHECD